MRRYRFRHPTASGKTIAAAGFVEAARTMGVLILTHRRLLVSQFNRELTAEGYGDRLTPVVERGQSRPGPISITVQTYAWFARHVGDLNREAYHLVIADEAHTALGEKTSGAIRSFPDPIYIGMTATEQLIAKQVSDVFPASVDDLPLQDAARRGLIAPLRCLRVPPVAAINSVPIVGGDFDERALAKVLDHTALNQAAASLYRDRFDDTPGIVYAAGVDHAYNLAQEFRAAGLKAEAVSGRTPPVRLAETLAAYERGEINVLINAMLLAEGWNSPRATVVMHLAPTASRRVYQQRIGRIMRMHPRKEAGIVVDFVNKGVDPHRARHLPPQPAGRRLLPRGRPGHAGAAPPAEPPRPPQALPGAVARPGHPGRAPTAVGHPARVAAHRPALPRRGRAALLGHDRRRARCGSRSASEFVKKLTDGKASKACLEQFLVTAAAENPNRRLRMMALADRVSMTVERADFDDLVTLVTQAAALGEGPGAGRRASCSGRSARESRRAGTDPGPLDVEARPRDAQGAGPQGQRGVRGGEATARRRWRTRVVTATRRTRRSSSTQRVELPLEVGAALLASAEGYTPRANRLIEDAREELGIAARRRLCAGREPAAAEDPDEPPTATTAQEEGQGPGGSGHSGAAVRRRGGTERAVAEQAAQAAKAATGRAVLG